MRPHEYTRSLDILFGQPFGVYHGVLSLFLSLFSRNAAQCFCRCFLLQK